MNIVYTAAPSVTEQEFIDIDKILNLHFECPVHVSRGDAECVNVFNAGDDEQYKTILIVIELVNLAMGFTVEFNSNGDQQTAFVAAKTH